jgi:hypothetical protein
MFKLLAILFGIGFIFAGVAGFVPALTPDGALLGIFQVDTMHNIVHIASGVLAIMASTSMKWTKLYFLIFGLAYLLVGIIGFARGGDLFMMHVNFADNVLHVGIGVLSLLIWRAAKNR